MKKKNTGDNLKVVRQKQRNDTYMKIDEALKFLSEKGLDITYQSIADVSGLSISTIYKSHTKNYILNHPIYLLKRKFTEVNSSALLNKKDEEIKKLKLKIQRQDAKIHEFKQERESMLQTINLLSEKNKELLFAVNDSQEKVIHSLYRYNGLRIQKNEKK